MDIKLYVVHGSHPCNAVAKALDLKGLPFKTVELPPPAHAAIMKLLTGTRTVPAIKIDGERLSGSRAILDRLDQLVPSPALLPDDPAARTAVLDAERWGDEVLQPLARRVLWPAMKNAPGAIASYLVGSRIPLPAPVAKLNAPVIARAEIKLNKATHEATQADLAALPGYLDRIDAWIADGTLGGEEVNRADLQIASSLRLLLTLADLRPYIDGRPCGELARRLFPVQAGNMPAGALPAAWLPPLPAAA